MLFSVDSITGRGVQALISTGRALNVYIAGGVAGILSQFNRMAGGAIAQRALAASQTASGIQFTGACLLYGIRVTASASGVLTIYDGVSAAGVQICTSLAVVANTTYYFAGQGVGEQMTTGIYVQLVSGTATWDVLTVPGV